MRHFLACAASQIYQCYCLNDPPVRLVMMIPHAGLRSCINYEIFSFIVPKNLDALTGGSGSVDSSPRAWICVCECHKVSSYAV